MTSDRKRPVRRRRSSPARLEPAPTREASTPAPDQRVTVGRISGAHGVKGEVRVEPETDFPDRFARGAGLWLGDRRVEVQSARWAVKALLVKLTGVDDRNAAEALRGAELTAEVRSDLGEGAFYQHDIIGMTAVDKAGTHLGQVSEIVVTGSNDVYVVKGERGELLLPATDDVVLSIDLAKKQITVDVIEGLEWEKPATSRPAHRGKRPPAHSQSPRPPSP